MSEENTNVPVDNNEPVDNTGAGGSQDNTGGSSEPTFSQSDIDKRVSEALKSNNAKLKEYQEKIDHLTGIENKSKTLEERIKAIEKINSTMERQNKTLEHKNGVVDYFNSKGFDGSNVYDIMAGSDIESQGKALDKFVDTITGRVIEAYNKEMAVNGINMPKPTNVLNNDNVDAQTKYYNNFAAKMRDKLNS